MLKTTKSPDEPALNRNNGSRLASGKNNGNGKVGFDSDGMEHVKKSGKSKNQKLSKLKKSKSEKNVYVQKSTSYRR